MSAIHQPERTELDVGVEGRPCGSCAARVEKVLAAGLLTPIIGGAAMVFSSVSVVSNSLRLYRFQRAES